MVLLNTAMAEVWHIHGTVVSKKYRLLLITEKPAAVSPQSLLCRRSEINFSKRIYRVLFQTVDNVQVSLCHLYGGMAQKARHGFDIGTFGEYVHRETVPRAVKSDRLCKETQRGKD